MSQTVNINEAPDYSVLNAVMYRLVTGEEFDMPRLGLEIIDGPYKGVTFGFIDFKIDMDKIENGQAPVTFVTKIYEAPEGWKQDEGFDNFCGDIFYAWLCKIQEDELPQFLMMKPHPGTH